MRSMNDHIYQLTNELWDVHLRLAKSADPEPLDPDLLRGLRAAADYIRHSLWVRNERDQDPKGRSLEQLLLTNRLRRASEMLGAALSQIESLHLSSEDEMYLEKIRALGSPIVRDKTQGSSSEKSN